MATLHLDTSGFNVTLLEQVFVAPLSMPMWLWNNQGHQRLCRTVKDTKGVKSYEVAIQRLNDSDSIWWWRRNSHINFELSQANPLKLSWDEVWKVVWGVGVGVGKESPPPPPPSLGIKQATPSNPTSSLSLSKPPTSLSFTFQSQSPSY